MEQKMENVFQNQPTNQIFKNLEPISDEYTPNKENLVCRDQEIADIAKNLKHILDGYAAKNFFITGNTGYGKTACTKIVLQDLTEVIDEQGIEHIYIEERDSEREILRKISKTLNLGFMGNDLLEYYDRLEQKILEEEFQLIIVVDEIDKLFKRSKKDHGNNVLKRLYETRKEVMNKGEGGLTVIGITNDVNITEYLNPKVRSRYGEETIHFPSYDALELKKILQVRAEQAFKPGALADGVLSKISAKVGQEDGDARKAIELLRKSGEIAVDKGQEQIKRKNVDTAHERLERNKTLEAVEKQSKQAKILLYSILDMKKGKAESGEVYSHYESVCEGYDIEPRTQRRIRQLVLDLDMMGLIQAEKENVSDGRGRTRRITSNHNLDLEDAIKNHVEEDVFLM